MRSYYDLAIIFYAAQLPIDTIIPILPRVITNDKANKLGKIATFLKIKETPRKRGFKRGKKKKKKGPFFKLKKKNTRLNDG